MQHPSYKVNLKVDKISEPDAIEEYLLLPVAEDMVNAVLEEIAAKQFDSIPSSSNTVSRRIQDMAMASDVIEQLIVKLRTKEYFSVHLEESGYYKHGPAFNVPKI